MPQAPLELKFVYSSVAALHMFAQLELKEMSKIARPQRRTAHHAIHQFCS
jgi:hypothetical protein